MDKSRKYILLLFDFFCYSIVSLSFVIITYLSSLSVRITTFEYIINAAILLVLVFILRITLHVYSCVWRYAKAGTYLKIVLADFCAGVIFLIATHYISVYTDYSIYFGIWQSLSIVSVNCLFTLITRFGYQLYRNYGNRVPISELNKIRIAIVGAGQVGVLLAEELSVNKKSHYIPYCFIDTDSSKIGNRIFGLMVYSENDDIICKIKQMPVQEIFIALPNLDGEAKQRLYEFYKKTDCKVKIYDFPFDNNHPLEEGKRQLREIKIEDLLFRDSLVIDNKMTSNYYSGRVILVTGGGGSIGSELCRQLAKRSPKQLIIFDIYENNAYEIQQELIRKYGNELDLKVIIGSVRDRKRLETVFAQYRPEIIFHAAAHKHVPLMENSGGEAIKNNVLGTYNTADMAEKYGALKFILISTDKAVNPTNIMGASKRMCEMIVQCRTDTKTEFAVVRFGNVLGSNGSVIPLFRKQIESGGPLTITDKRIIRYFMTIPEAVQLVMQAGAMANDGELFVLDMGKPVKIIDLAENMIKLSGLIPYQDIDIVEIGLRPGEKLYEELLIKSEALQKTSNDLIFIEHDVSPGRIEIERKIKLLLTVTDADIATVKCYFKRAVPTYRDPEEVNCMADQSEEMNMVNGNYLNVNSSIKTSSDTEEKVTIG